MELTRERIEKWRGAFQYEFCASAETDAICDLALAALDRKWRPIETAPKDGTVVFGINATNREWPCSMVFRRTFDGTKEWADVCGDSLTPTHYIPLPEPPEVKP